MTQLHELLATTRGNAMIDYEDEFMSTVITQFKNLQNADLTIDSFAIKVYRNLLTTMDAVSKICYLNTCMYWNT